MTKVKLLTIAALISTSMSAWADKGVLVLRAPKPEGCSAQIAYPSSNGVWAVGGVHDGSTYQAYRWNTLNNEFEYLNAYGDFSFGYSVSNDGIVVGEYTTHELLPNGAGIQSPCAWYDGKWHVLNLGSIGALDPEQASIGAARHISPDGKHVVGAVCTSEGWKACTWLMNANKQSTLTMLPMEENGVAEHVSDDGIVIGGFDLSGGVRIPAYWSKSGNGKYVETIPDGRKHSGAWTIVSGVSPDGNYVASWNKLFNLKNGNVVQFDENTNVDAVTVAGVTSDGTVYGTGNVINEEGLDRFAAFYQDGKWIDVQKWLEGKGAKFDSDYKVNELRYMSDDRKIFFFNVTCSDGLTGGLMVCLDEEITCRPPIALKGIQMNGLKAVKLSWKEPLTNAAGVQEYIVTRNNEVVYRGKNLHFTDRNCEFGQTYTYTVKASYLNETSVDCDPVTVTVAARPTSAPSALNARQAGVNNIRLTWDAAGTSLSELKYYSEAHDVSGFGGGEWNIEAGVRFRNEDLLLYENMQINEVSFWPMSPQFEWNVNFYKASDTHTPIYSETLDASTLNYGSQNTIRLKSPVQIPGNEDLVVGLSATVKGSSFNVIGLMPSDNDPGYTDLIRQPGEEFVSLYEDGLKNGYEYPYSWPISLGLATIGGNISSLTGYNVYQNGEKLATVDANTLKYVQRDVADGTYSYEVSAVYSDSKESVTSKTDVTVKRDTKYYSVDEIITKQTFKELEAIVEWKAPMDDERTMIAYCEETSHHGVQASAADGYSFQAASIFNLPMFKQYLDDYQISGVCFYPVGNAEFALYLNEPGKTRWSIELERGVDYELNKWNTIRLDKPILLDANINELQLIIDCYDGDAKHDILAMDNMPANHYYSDLYSLDDGISWESYNSQTGGRGNWMMGLLITSREAKPLPIKNYILTWDDATGDDETVVPADGPLSIMHTFGKTSEAAHKVVITTVFDNGESWSSEPHTIDWMTQLTPIVEINKDADPVGEVYDLSGRKVGSDRAKLMKGIYINNGKKIVKP